MDIIALLLHISWDRKCSYQILVSEAEAETVVCSCFRIAPDLELPAVKPERGSTDFVRGWGGVGCSRTVWMHRHTRRPTMDTRVTQRCPYFFSPEPIHMPSIERSPAQSPRHTPPYLNWLLTCRSWCSTKPERGKKSCFDLRKIVTRYWAYTEQVKPPRGDNEPLLQ